ncbi:DUF2254 domain-containing protein [Pokkaliibacter sp. CJK22405]|uniref:DUF2254 domain-containing protein n=1 Tax=Pokkaliibacter sp. CJK22405 TaxID=3384615 RepID=UPI003985123D
MTLRDVTASRWFFYLRLMVRRMWFRSSLYCLLAIFTVLVSPVANSWIPKDWASAVGADSIDGILNILASSMLAVTTFSLTTVVSAFATASSATTPRATKLLIQNSNVQSALATFIGAFLYSIVGIVALSTPMYEEGSRFVLFIVTIVVIVVITVTLLRWIEQISHLGRVGETIDLVEQTGRESLSARALAPELGGQRLTPDMALPAFTMNAPDSGFLQHVDMKRLQEVAEDAGAKIYLLTLPGHLVSHYEPLFRFSGDLSPAQRETVASAVIVGDARTYSQDPRLGFVVAQEIAIRALSPAVNDPGTAIKVLGAQLRMLECWARTVRESRDQLDVCYDRIYVPAIDINDFFMDAFNPIARDGAAFIEVGLRLQRVLQGLCEMGFDSYKEPIRFHAELAMERGGHGMTAETDKALLRQAYEQTQKRWRVNYPD